MDGWVYVLSNKSMPGLVKIGFSLKDPQLRASELFQTGTPTPFVVQYSAYVKNAQSVEFATHKHLNSYRINRNREFFRCEVWDAVKAIESLSKPTIINNYAAELEELRERQERKEIREEFINREIAPYIEWQKKQLKELNAKRSSLTDVPYLYHFYGWLLVVMVSSGIPALTSNDALLLIILFAGPLFTRPYHVSLIEKSDAYKQFDEKARQINSKVSEKLLSLEREAEDEWGD